MSIKLTRRSAAALRCSWAAATSSPAAGTGGGLIQFVAAPNPGSARTGVIRIAGQDYLVTESGR